MRYISFNSMGGSAAVQLSGGEGTAITWPADSVKQGYVFGGWYTSTTSSGALREKGSQQFSAQAMGAVFECSGTLTVEVSTDTIGEDLEVFDSSELNRYLYFTVS